MVKELVSIPMLYINAGTLNAAYNENLKSTPERCKRKEVTDVNTNPPVCIRHQAFHLNINNK